MPCHQGAHKRSVTKILPSLVWQGHFLLEEEKSHINYTSKLGPRLLELPSLFCDGGRKGSWFPRQAMSEWVGLKDAVGTEVDFFGCLEDTDTLSCSWYLRECPFIQDGLQRTKPRTVNRHPHMWPFMNQLSTEHTEKCNHCSLSNSHSVTRGLVWRPGCLSYPGFMNKINTLSLLLNSWEIRASLLTTLMPALKLQYHDAMLSIRLRMILCLNWQE